MYYFAKITKSDNNSNKIYFFEVIEVENKENSIYEPDKYIEIDESVYSYLKGILETSTFNSNNINNNQFRIYAYQESLSSPITDISIFKQNNDESLKSFENIDDITELVNNIIETVNKEFLLKSKKFEINMHMYISSAMYLMSRGYFITEENKNKKYIEIIQTKDSDLINKLNTYLSYYDKMDLYKIFYNRYTEFLNNLSKLSNKNEILELFENYNNTL